MRGDHCSCCGREPAPHAIETERDGTQYLCDVCDEHFRKVDEAMKRFGGTPIKLSFKL